MNDDRAASHGDAGHWDAAYVTGGEDRSWYQEHAAVSMELIQEISSPGDAVIDVGAGASKLVDDLLEAGFRDITCLDISIEGIEVARRRLGTDAQQVDWVIGDLLTWRPQRVFDVWHDRAVLHFLTTEALRDAYRRALLAATEVGSHVVIGVFGPNGPTHCSGLEVARFDQDSIAAFLGGAFTEIRSTTRAHVTPGGSPQEFVWTTATRL